MNEPYLIRAKEGLWWMPNSCGYTTNVLMAGIYTKTQAVDQEASSKRCKDPNRTETAEPLEMWREHIERFHAALHPEVADPPAPVAAEEVR